MSNDDVIISSSSTAPAANDKKRTRPNGITTSSNTTKRIKTSSTSATPTASMDNVRVVARIRPLNSTEQNEPSRHAITAVNGVSVRVDAASNNKSFTYDGAFGPETSQSQLYQRTVGDLVKTHLFQGFNVTVMAYGQTGSGKTFTMGTEAGGCTNDNNDNNNQSKPLAPPTDSDGIIPRAVFDVFQQRQQLGDDRVLVHLSYLEIYNEEVRDLLTDTTNVNLQIRELGSGVVVQGLSSQPVTSPQQVQRVMAEAAKRRATASTNMNAVSSRSHAICTLTISIAPHTPTAFLESGIEDNKEQDATDSISLEEDEVRAKLTLVDLAGSERIKRTGAEGKRLKEGININKGLFVLGQVVSALSEMGQACAAGTSSSNSHIPYRDSKLTRLLQDSLGGNSKTVMVACISPAESNVDESINTLRYAQRTRNIHNAAVRNVVSTENPRIAALQLENARLLQQLAMMQQQVQQQQAAATTTSIVAASTATITNTSVAMATDNQPQTIQRLESKILLLEAQVEALQEQQVQAQDDVLVASLRADKWQLQFEQLKQQKRDRELAADGHMDTGNVSPSKESLDIVSTLRKQVFDVQGQLKEALADAAVARMTAAAIVAGNGDLSAVAEQLGTTSATTSPMSDDNGNIDRAAEDNKYDEDAANQEQLALTAELMAVSGGIEAKEKLAMQASKELECMKAMRCHFENAFQSLQQQVEVLAAERDSLLNQVGGNGQEVDENVSSDRKPSMSNDNDQARFKMKHRIADLELRINDLRQKAAEHQNSLRLREAAEQKCAKLAAEIQVDKKRRVALQKQLKEQASERRAEKQAAKMEATKLLRDSNRLKVELEKVKNAASKQAAVLQRKAAEALQRQKRDAQLHARKDQQQLQRNHLAAMRANAKNDAGVTDFAKVTVRRKQELKDWLDRELESAGALKATREQMEEQSQLLRDANTKLRSLQRHRGDSSAVRAVEEEIQLRSGVIEQLEKNVAELTRCNSASNATLVSSSPLLLDMALYHGLTRPEADVVFLDSFDRLLQLKKDMDTMLSKRESFAVAAVNAAVTKERRAHEDEIIELKMNHSQAMMDLLNSTKGSIEQSVRLNSLRSVVDPDFQSAVEQMLESYLDGCNKVGASVQTELQDVKQAQQGMKEIVETVATGFISANEPLVVVSKSQTVKKCRKKKSLEPYNPDQSILDHMAMFSDDDDGEGDDESDDPDWTPTQQNKTKKKSLTKEGQRAKHDSSAGVDAIFPFDDPAPVRAAQPVAKLEDVPEIDDIQDKIETAVVVDYSKLKVKELRELLRARDLVVAGVKTALITRLQEHDLKRSNGATGIIDLTEEDVAAAGTATGGDSSKENTGATARPSRRTSNRCRAGVGGTISRGLQTRDMNQPSAAGNENLNAKTATLDLPPTPPQSAMKHGVWSTKKTLSVRRSTIFNKRALSPALSSPERNNDGTTNWPSLSRRLNLNGDNLTERGGSASLMDMETEKSFIA